MRPACPPASAAAGCGRRPGSRPTAGPPAGTPGRWTASRAAAGPGAPAVGAQRAAVGADGGPVGSDLASHRDEILLVDAFQQVPRPRAGADHQGRQAGRLQGAQAGQAHADIANPVGQADIQTAEFGHGRAPGRRSRTGQGGRRRAAGTIHRIIVLKRVIPLNSAARKATLGSEPVKAELWGGSTSAWAPTGRAWCLPSC